MSFLCALLTVISVHFSLTMDMIMIKIAFYAVVVEGSYPIPVFAFYQ